MQIEIREIEEDIKEYIKIGHHRKSSEMKEILRFIKSRGGNIGVKRDDRQFSIPVVDIFYIESVDDRVFVYLKDECYESGQKLYELEELLRARRFVRISKSVIVNLMKAESIKPALNGRYLCRMINGEDVIISRKYVADFKAALAR